MWIKKIIQLYEAYAADNIIVETNQGGNLIENLLRAHHCTIPLKAVYATKSKRARAEPVASLYERGLIYHAPGLATLEKQLCCYTGKGKSPDRMDALVWGLTELFLHKKRPATRVWQE